MYAVANISNTVGNGGKVHIIVNKPTQLAIPSWIEYPSVAKGDDRFQGSKKRKLATRVTSRETIYNITAENKWLLQRWFGYLIVSII